MTERRSTSPEAVVPETGPGVDAWAARRTSEGKPRREPYRPSSSSTAAPAATTTAPSRPSTHATHLDVAAPLNALGAAPLPPLPSSTGEEAAARRSGLHSRVNSLAGAAPTTATTAGDSSLHGSASGVPAHTSGPIAEKAALARSSLPDSLIQQIRSTPYSSSLASRPAAVAAATHHRRTLSSLSGAAVPANAEAAEGVAATSAVPVRRAPSPVAALSSPLREKYAAPFALTPDDGHHTHQSSRRPTSFHASVLSINSASEAPLSWSPPAAATVKMSVHEMLAPLPPSSGSKHATIAHIMQRERVRTLLSRCLLRWSLFRSANTPPAARRGRAAVLTSPLPPWRPIAGGNFRSASSADEREAGGHNDDDDLVDVTDATAATAAAAPLRPSTPVAREVGKAAAGSVSRPSTLASRHAQPNGTVMSPLRVTTPQLLASASTSRGTTNGESCGDISHSGSSAPHHPQQQQVPAATQGGSGDGGARRRTPRERSPTTDASPFAASLPRSSSQQDLPPLHMSGLPATLPVTAAAATTAAASPRSISPSVGGATTAYVPPSIASAAGQTNSTSTSSNAATTPRQQVGEARRKSVVSQYLAGKPLGNLSPQQSTTNLFSGGAASTGGVVEVHTLSLPGSAAASSPAAHSRTQSGMGGGGSVPRRRSDGLRGSSATATTVAGALNVAGGLCSDSEEQSTSSLYFTPRSRQSNGLGGLGMPCDDDPCLSNSSMSLAAAAPLGNGGGGGGQGLGAAMAQSIPQLLVMEAEERAAVQASEQRRRTRKQREMLAHMDQLMMAALHHRSGERGLHPSLRPSAAPSPMATSRCSSGSGDEGERDSVNHSCSTSDYVVLTEGGLAGRRSAQRSPGWASTRSSVSAGIPTPTAGAAGGAAAVLTAATPRQQPGAVSATAPASHPVRPHLSAPVVTALSSVSRRLSHTHRGGAEEGEGEKDSAESLSDVSGDDADPAGIAGGSASRGGDREGEGSRVRYHHRHRHPLRSEASRGERGPGAVEDDDDDEADTATAQSECTVHGLATTRQWVSQQTPETAAAAAAAALTAASESPETSSTSLSLSQPPVQTSASAKRKGSG